MRKLVTFVEMNTVIRHTECLITAHDCVVFPGMGAVIAQYHNAGFGEGCISAPYRSFMFNASLSHNDGLLISSVSRAESISYEQAERKVMEEIDAMRTQLEADGELSLGRLGHLIQENGTIAFAPYEHGIFSPMLASLPRLTLKTIGELVSEQAVTEESCSEKTREYNSRWIRLGRIAASVAVVLSLGFVLSTPLKYDPATQMASLAPAVHKSTVKPVEQGKLLVKIPSLTSEETGISKSENEKPVTENIKQPTSKEETAVKEPRKELEKKSAAVKETVIKPVSVSATGRYVYVVASLPSRPEAEKFIRRSSVSGLNILEKDGRFRVYALSGNSSAELQKQARQLGLDSKYQGAWVCRR
ncbi:MAG: hypothetical protein K2M79_03580 [Muribaculaceae bacterium]|nr:hypothetical protein [Muribaculaceae bacterium]